MCDYGWDEVDANVQLGYAQQGTTRITRVRLVHVHCFPPFCTAAIINTFGAGEGPILLYNVTCNRTHTELSQCVHPLSIGLRDCVSQDKRAGVICLELASFTTTAISTSRSLSYTLQTTEPSTATTPPNHFTARLQIIVFAVVGGVLALVIITAICICFIGVTIARKGKGDTKLEGKIEITTHYSYTTLCTSMQ